MTELTTPDEFEHQIVTVEAVEDCKCGADHGAGHALWGGKVDPREVESIKAFETVRDLHDGEVKYEHR